MATLGRFLYAFLCMTINLWPHPVVQQAVNHSFVNGVYVAGWSHERI